ncbi:MAG TPA: histidine kinase dimerization/phospho-acceptor domain-containing protein, partial [Candidatus Baltobacteraceae bacterium]|nr:histidine kinase dimerization/phospho-acceptor domain-containing protein [Candidatus Baltobacteraceae bacterium]
MATRSRADAHCATMDALADRLCAADANAVSTLLAFRLPDLADLAWQYGKRAARQLERRAVRAFGRACATLLRGSDLIAHDAGSDRFIAALIAPPRSGSVQRLPAGRCALERIAGEMHSRLGVRVEAGWTPVAALPNRAALDGAVERALERGLRERERYEFFAAVGHELRTPLSAIRGYIETVLDERPDDATAQRFLEVARREAMRMGRLLEGMFEFSLLDLSAGAGASCSASEQLEAACDA